MKRKLKLSDDAKIIERKLLKAVWNVDEFFVPDWEGSQTKMRAKKKRSWGKLQI